MHETTTRRNGNSQIQILIFLNFYAPVLFLLDILNLATIRAIYNNGFVKTLDASPTYRNAMATLSYIVLNVLVKQNFSRSNTGLD